MTAARRGWDAVVGLGSEGGERGIVDGDGGLEFGQKRRQSFGGKVGGVVAFAPTAGVVGSRVR